MKKHQIAFFNTYLKVESEKNFDNSSSFLFEILIDVLLLMKSQTRRFNNLLKPQTISTSILPNKIQKRSQFNKISVHNLFKIKITTRLSLEIFKNQPFIYFKTKLKVRYYNNFNFLKNFLIRKKYFSISINFYEELD